MHSTVRTSRCSASSSAGGRVCGVIESSLRRGPITSASRTTIQPLGVRQVVTRTFVPGSYGRATGWLMPNGPRRNEPAARSSSEPKTLGESNWGTQSQSIAPSGATKAPVWQFERNAYSAIGGNGDGAAALGADDATGFPSVLAFVATELMRAFRQGPLRRESLGSQRGSGIIRCE